MNVRKIWAVIGLAVAIFAIGTYIYSRFSPTVQAPTDSTFRGPTGGPYVKGPTEDPPMGSY
ncbi:MAG: hypothetical protein A3B23_02305 [Candidatus Colwellbacteria bacterium RIFCSPLOWO2_01_FULL_48_10]|uniref:Uncharacterized protein n=2 Tax=Bacteria candidate phyla TaxID=1783234 RepID=A0A1F5P468_9BACT|nr:MAG: hypothetical protein A2846_03590 [Candidatus Doudnabacteria bacterium RIFCSPHIGHO2_01_FULL_49_9]OGY59956.1 MAG: hypothetical protein A3B23_02305 [Candidatus Colwellbacteria bacterium RIFCSPLOWO2_01_FULL_48_10]